MSPKLQPVRGTHDILPDDFEKFSAVTTLARELATLYGFREMATPIFESTDVFSRSMGETSDVVSKEMFTFETKGEDKVTLRPEFTAGIVRAFISNGMQQHLPLKLFSTGPLFRYERPQKGRQRQFHQVNFEWLGDDSPEIDAEIIMLAGQLLYSLSGKKGCTLLINTLGDKESRERYREALVTYLTPLATQLSEDSQRRLVSNPLRILDSKDPRDKSIIADAPKITDYLSDSSKQRFDVVCATLETMPFLQNWRVDPSLVRGLDYYTDTVFEFVGEVGELGAQNTVLAGGRYDGLVEQMGGKPTPAIGFAAGVERLLLLADNNLQKKSEDIKIIIIPLDGYDKPFAIFTAGTIRLSLRELLNDTKTKRQGAVEVLWQGNLKKRMEKAHQRNASHVFILGPEEFLRGVFIIKNMRTGNQSEALLDSCKDWENLHELLEIEV
ncbi:MAG: histidine--tRNA ligase [Alphaproteobacteria bacterium]|nr:histidine--tRNA ligase [Alphaproteobacteria bacterium]